MCSALQQRLLGDATTVRDTLAQVGLVIRVQGEGLMLARVVLVTPARVGEPMLDPVGLAIRGQVVVRMQAQGVRDIRGLVEQPTRVPVVTLTQALAVPVIAAQEVLVIQVQEGATVVQRFVNELVIG